MELKDLTQDAIDMAEVRGGMLALPAFGGNYASNVSTNGPVMSGVFVGAGHSNNSGFNLTNEVVQQNTTTQMAGVEDRYSSTRTLTFDASQLNIGLGGWSF